MKALFSYMIILMSLTLSAQSEDEQFIRKIFDEALTNQKAYENLRVLCKDIGHRLSGSQSANKAIKWGEAYLKSLKPDTVWKQKLLVNNWKRGLAETAYFEVGLEKINIKIKALGGSVSTKASGLTAPLIEVKDFTELENTPAEAIKGKIVFINKPMDPKKIKTFKAYSSCFSLRYKGAVEVAKKGGLGLLLRSLSLSNDHEPHTGSMTYSDSIIKIPAAAIGTSTADSLHKLLKHSAVKTYMRLNCKQEKDTSSFNVIGELKGTEFPKEYIVVGGHLDSWDVGEGAHDDGAGCVQSMEVIRLFKALNYKPKRSIRTILFMNEENGNAGGIEYAINAKRNNEKHLAALESDRGGFTPRGFTYETKTKKDFDFKVWKKLLEPYGISFINPGFSGVDIRPLKPQGTLLFGYEPDSQRYFDFHHSDKDVFENVHPRELSLGAACMASLIYLIDKYGIDISLN
jgi:Zn-dependent M28 family amino/carboxypeptidase